MIIDMKQEDIWDAVTAQNYDTPGSGMFSPAVIEPTVKRLAALANGGRALEFAIGTGRVAIPLVQKGVSVTGIELSKPMIEQLRKKIDESSLPVLYGDMKNVVAPGNYTLVYLVYNTISNLLTQEDQIACFKNAARHLLPGGRFVIELWVPELRKLPSDQEAVVFSNTEGNIGVDTYDLLMQQVVSHHFRFDRNGKVNLFRSPHRYIWPSELDLMAQLTGFTLESRTADWAGSPFSADSKSHVSVYRLKD
jgi:SAM-dependent methyltransferase